MRKLFLIFSGILLTQIALSCTVAIIPGKYTADRRPLLYKHRDNDAGQVKIMAFMKGKFPFLGLTDADDEDQSVWIGFNSAGFAIMNSASYNLNDKNDVAKDREGWLIREALANCADVPAFELFLQNLKKPYGVEANFGVIDAKGNAAFFETGNHKFVKIDANEPRNTPLGFALHTNFSFSGRYNDGSGYIRYMNAEMAMFALAHTNSISPQGIIQKVSRNLFHSMIKKDLWGEIPFDEKTEHFVSFEDYTPRFISSSSVVIQGVLPGESPSLTTMWTALGWPLASVTVPVWLTKSGNLPAMLTAAGTANAPLCEKAVTLKMQCFPIHANNKSRYMNLAALINTQSTGILQKIIPIENAIFAEAEKTMQSLRKEKPDDTTIISFYEWVDRFVQDEYKKAFGL
ncbi:MAG: hypothetical protein V2A54_12485 [Bacteroidota bacterium]